MDSILGKFLWLVVCVFISINGFSQGCSDAGFCSINSNKHTQDSSSFANQIRLGLSYGSADQSIGILSQYVDYSRQLNDKLGLDFRITALSQSGEDVSAFGIGDIFLNANYAVGSSTKISLGAKIPLTDGNSTSKGLPLPLDFQSSLGTFDLLLGVSHQLESGLKFNLAYQQPLTQNSNAFFSSLYTAGTELSQFQSTNEFVRSGDILLRISYPMELDGKLSVTPSLLPIYHLSNDKFTDEGGVEQEIEGSSGLTVNANLGFNYTVSDKSGFELSLGAPAVVRTARPDGLTRSFVATLQYGYSF